jgi:hypothetical protein
VLATAVNCTLNEAAGASVSALLAVQLRSLLALIAQLTPARLALGLP